MSVSGCDSSRVISAQKTIVHEHRIYNVSVVREAQAVRGVVLPGGNIRDLNRIDDNGQRDLFERHDEIRARTTVMLDDNDPVCFNRMIENRCDLDALDRRFMAHRKRTPLELD